MQNATGRHRRPALTLGLTAVPLVLALAGVASAVVLTGVSSAAGPSGATATAHSAVARHVPPRASRLRHGAPLPHPVVPIGTARVVALGDSVATGYGCDCTPYPGLLAASLGAGSTVVDDARDGATTADLAARLDEPAVRGDLARATLVTVTVGANDLDGSQAGEPGCAPPGLGCWADDLAALPGSLGDVLDRVHTLAPDARVLVTGYWNVFQDGDVGAGRGAAAVASSAAATAAVDEVVARAATTHDATYVDLAAPYQTSVVPVTDLLAPDGDHPSAAGHALIAQALHAALTGVPTAG